MKFLFVLNIGLAKGGPSVHLLKDVIGAALACGHSCHVVLKNTTEENVTGLEELIERHHALTISLVRSVSTRKSGFLKRYMEDCRYALRCKKEYKGKQYDAVFLQSCNVGWVFMKGLRSLKCPIVFNVQDIFPQNLMFSGQLPMSKIVYPLFLRLQMIAYKRATRLITISEDMKDTLVAQGVKESKIDVVYNWSYEDAPISLSAIPSSRMYDLKTDPQKTNVVYAGNIGKMQNVELIAKTAKISEQDTGVHYYIIGDGANKQKVLSMVDELSNVTVLPMQDAKFAESIYAQADINVIPLAKGGIKTALPSKTATVLRTDKYVVFCIDAGSKFAQTVDNARRIRIADNADPASLYHIICELRDTKQIDLTKNDCVLPLFAKENANCYVKIMESATHKSLC